MRPSDENQPASMRPNLMSPRRTSGEDSILAMLERDTARKRGTKAPGGRLAWYGAGAGLTVVVALTGTLVWLAAGNDGLQPEVQRSALAETGRTPQHGAAASPAGGATILQVAMAPAAAAPQPQQGNAAVIVDQRPTPEGVPPLRLLKPAPAKAAPAVRVPVPAAAPPARPVAKATPPSRPAGAAEGKPAARTAAVPFDAKPAARAAAVAPRARPLVAAKGALRPAPPKAQRSPAPGKGADAPADADVALISAVITHANGHAPEGSQMTELMCPNNACQSKPARQ